MTNTQTAIRSAIAQSVQTDSIQKIVVSGRRSTAIRNGLARLSDDWTDQGDGVYEYWASGWRVHVVVLQ